MIELPRKPITPNQLISIISDPLAVANLRTADTATIPQMIAADSRIINMADGSTSLAFYVRSNIKTPTTSPVVQFWGISTKKDVFAPITPQLTIAGPYTSSGGGYYYSLAQNSAVDCLGFQYVIPVIVTAAAGSGLTTCDLYAKIV